MRFLKKERTEGDGMGDSGGAWGGEISQTTKSRIRRNRRKGKQPSLEQRNLTVGLVGNQSDKKKSCQEIPGAELNASHGKGDWGQTHSMDEKTWKKRLAKQNAAGGHHSVTAIS